MVRLLGTFSAEAPHRNFELGACSDPGCDAASDAHQFSLQLDPGSGAHQT